MSEKTLYGKRDIVSQGKYYARHVDAMTAEGLHDKSDIAAELAHRDIEIALLAANLRDAARFAPEPQKSLWLLMIDAPKVAKGKSDE